MALIKCPGCQTDVPDLAPALAQPVLHQRHPDLLPFLTQLPVQTRRRQPLLRRRAWRPLLDQLL